MTDPVTSELFKRIDKPKATAAVLLAVMSSILTWRLGFDFEQNKFVGVLIVLANFALWTLFLSVISGLWTAVARAFSSCRAACHARAAKQQEQASAQANEAAERKFVIGKLKTLNETQLETLLYIRLVSGTPFQAWSSDPILDELQGLRLIRELHPVSGRLALFEMPQLTWDIIPVDALTPEQLESIKGQEPPWEARQHQASGRI